jgi:hypothetical protein
VVIFTALTHLFASIPTSLFPVILFSGTLFDMLFPFLNSMRPAHSKSS